MGVEAGRAGLSPPALVRFYATFAPQYGQTIHPRSRFLPHAHSTFRPSTSGLTSSDAST